VESSPHGAIHAQRNPGARFYYIYAIDYDAAAVGRQAYMCTREKEFTIRALRLPGTRYDRTGFYEIDTGEQRPGPSNSPIRPSRVQP